MPNTEIRPARPEDRDAVLAFTASTWEWGDYISYVWDEWLHDPSGLLLVATVDGQSVGMAHLRMLNATDAWLEGIRVDPAHRHHGIATALDNALLVEAMRRGATNVRLITESTNIASIHMIEHSFNRVGAFAPYKAPPVTTPLNRHNGLETPTLATADDINDIIDYLNNSTIFPAVGGLYYSSFTAYTITDALLEAKISAQQVYLLRRWNRLDGLTIAEPREGRQDKQLFIGYIDGTTESISLLAYAMRIMLPQFGVEAVQANVPDLIMVRDAFTGAEYEWDGHVFYIYERELT